MTVEYSKWGRKNVKSQGKNIFDRWLNTFKQPRQIETWSLHLFIFLFFFSSVIQNINENTHFDKALYGNIVTELYLLYVK